MVHLRPSWLAAASVVILCADPNSGRSGGPQRQWKSCRLLAGPRGWFSGELYGSRAQCALSERLVSQFQMLAQLDWPHRRKRWGRRLTSSLSLLRRRCSRMGLATRHGTLRRMADRP